MIEISKSRYARTEPTFPEVTHVEDGCLENINKGETGPPEGKPWTSFLFCHRERPNGGRFVVIVTGRTRAKRDAELLAFMERDDVRLIGYSDEELAAL